MSAEKKTEQARRILVREELLSRAADVFERRGFGQTRIEDIAAALDLKRSAIYYYFKTKNDVLQALIDEFAEAGLAELQLAATETPGKATDRLRALLECSITNRTTAGAKLRALDVVSNDIPDEMSAQFNTARRKVLDLFVTVIREGIEAGEFREQDPTIAAFAVLGISNWTSWWYRPNGRYDPDLFVPQLIETAIRGVSRTDTDPEQGRSFEQILDTMERDIDALRHSGQR